MTADPASRESEERRALWAPPGAPRPPQPPAPRRPSLWLLGLTALVVLVPIWTWYGSWFGRSLDDEQMLEFLAEDARPRDVQHALEAQVRRLVEGEGVPAGVRAAVLRQASRPEVPVRRTLAWALGHDPAAEVRPVLGALLTDEDALVRVNAACALAKHRDARARPTLLASLDPGHPAHAEAAPEAVLGGALAALALVGTREDLAAMAPFERDARAPVRAAAARARAAIEAR